MFDHDFDETLSADPQRRTDFPPKVVNHADLLDDTILKRSSSFLAGGIAGEYVSCDRENGLAYSTGTTDRMQFLLITQDFAPEETGGFLFKAHDRERPERRAEVKWSKRHTIIAFSMVITDK